MRERERGGGGGGGGEFVGRWKVGLRRWGRLMAGRFFFLMLSFSFF
eukprot:COSAG02_NODE_750_length_17669_cov_242.395595_14_plen_45_part_01